VALKKERARPGVSLFKVGDSVCLPKGVPVSMTLVQIARKGEESAALLVGRNHSTCRAPSP